MNKGREIVRTSEGVSKSVEEIQKNLQPILSQPLENIIKDMTPIEKADLYVSLAYIANSLFFMLLRTKGVDTKNHPVMNEMKRIKAYMKKIKASKDPNPNPVTKEKKIAGKRKRKQKTKKKKDLFEEEENNQPKKKKMKINRTV